MHPERERLLKLAHSYLDAIRPRIDAMPVGEQRTIGYDPLSEQRTIDYDLWGEQRTIANELYRAIATVIYALREPEK